MYENRTFQTGPLYCWIADFPVVIMSVWINPPILRLHDHIHKMRWVSSTSETVNAWPVARLNSKRPR